MTSNNIKVTGKCPSGEEIMATLIGLLEEQEGIKITYQLVKKSEEKCV